MPFVKLAATDSSTRHSWPQRSRSGQVRSRDPYADLATQPLEWPMTTESS